MHHLGTSRQLAYISLLETFLSHERLSIRLLTMDAITQIWLEVSDNDPHVKQQVSRDAARHLWFLVGNPKRHTVSGEEMEQLFQTYCDEVIHNLRAWLALQEKSWHPF
ncbi:hypothetical protein [Ktedonospora formicarum]|uniref:Uncharacterized protein n=1 Tax=Ktedonospora formicarum TaxID=2778364 RepID=A0A8J3I528_9CHLR|nr:hypothetical protein [Ktedonospora formicarum]GHO49649.1 hypothetical protein KSX_78120 [Ktedonospora formicarum]